MFPGTVLKLEHTCAGCRPLQEANTFDFTRELSGEAVPQAPAAGPLELASRPVASVCMSWDHVRNASNIDSWKTTTRQQTGLLAADYKALVHEGPASFLACAIGTDY